MNACKTMDGRAVASRFVAAMIVCVASAATRAQVTVRTSVATVGLQANDDSYGPALSADGRFAAFSSLADNLVAGDGNGADDIFVRDLMMGTTERVSVASDGREGTGSSLLPALSADGRFVAFCSDAPNLVSGDTNGQRDVFVHDRVLRTTERVSVDSTGVQGDAASGQGRVRHGDTSEYRSCVVISHDGRFVVFWSQATNLVPSDTNDMPDLFIHDREQHRTMRASLGQSGVEANDESWHADLSADNRSLVFDSRASNLVPGVDTNSWDVFVRDLVAGTTRLISVDSTGAQAQGACVGPAISANGRWVSFQTAATNLVPKERPWWFAIVHDLATGESTAEMPLDLLWNGSACPLSGDGRFLACHSAAVDLVPGDTNKGTDVFVLDRKCHHVERMSLADDGNQAKQACSLGGLSDDGHTVAFLSKASNLVSGDTNRAADTFVHRRVALALNGKLVPGHRIQFAVSQAHARQTGNVALVLWSSTGLSRWVLPGGNELNLAFDGCTVSGLFHSALFSGVIDASGMALTPTIPAPDLPPGLRLFAAAVTLAADRQVVSVTSPLVLTTE